MPVPKHIRQMPSVTRPPYAAMTIRETMLEPTKPEMMAALVDTATSRPLFARIASLESADSSAAAVQTVYSPPGLSACTYQ